MTQNIPLAVLLTVVTTVLFAAAATLQHRVVGEQLDDDQASGSLSGGQFWSLIRSGRWWAGMGLNGLGAVITVAALMLAPVSVVQPLAILAVPWTVLLTSRIYGHRIAPAVWGAVGLAVAGTAWFALVAVQHAVEKDTFDETGLVAGALVLFALSGLLALAGARGPRGTRCLAWASAGAVIFGLESGLVKAAGEIVAAGTWRGSPIFWAIMVMLVVGAIVATGFMQQGYASGPAETVVGAMNAVGPISAVAFGMAVLGEGAELTASAAVTMAAAGAVAVLGVVLLSRVHPGADQDARPAATTASP